MTKETTFVAFYCFGCNRMYYGVLGVDKCSVCGDDIKYIKTFNCEAEIEIYCTFMNKSFMLVDQKE